ncbi:MAG: RNA methyltransferase [Bacteroidales bacterium]
MLSKSTISFIRSLEHKKYRQKHQLFVAEGEKLVRELCTTMQAHHIYTCNNNSNGEWISQSEMAKISFLKTPSPTLGIFELPASNYNTPIISNNQQLTLALDGVQNPGNLGTIIRQCSWFGIKQLLCSTNTVDCYNPKVLQATMGAIAQVEVHYLDLAAFLAQSSNLNIFGTFLEGTPIYQSKLAQGGIVVMGSEGQGISTEVAQQITLPLYIPAFNPQGNVESLNVAIASSIICYEFCRKVAARD